MSNSTKEMSAEMQRLREYLDDLLEKAKRAGKELEKYSQEQVDALVKAIGKAIFDNAVELAEFAVKDTGMGVVEDKIAKNRGKANMIWWSLRDKKSVGIIDRDEATGIIKVAKPVGIVGAITPVTNPSVTPMSNSMFAIKGRNPIIIAPHPRALATGVKTVKCINDELKKLGAPENCIQILEIPSLELTQMLASDVDVVIATGGAAMVKAVYSSGKPALGVGSGNIQALIDIGVDYEAAASKIATGRGFDNGIICTGEQSVIAPRKDFDKIMQCFSRSGAYVVPDSQRDALRDTLFPGGEMNRSIVGQDAPIIAEAAGITVPKDTRVLVVEAVDSADVLGAEKIFPVLSSYRYDTWQEAIEIARNNLEKAGKGHSICIHSDNNSHIEEAALKTEVSRIVVNQVCASSGGGSFYNGLNPTNTLGCGSWGNNSISENLTYYHLINVSRIAYNMAGNKVPSEQEIWG